MFLILFFFISFQEIETRKSAESQIYGVTDWQRKNCESKIVLNITDPNAIACQLAHRLNMMLNPNG